MIKTAMLPEVFLSDRKTSAAVTRMVQAGNARKIRPKLYTRNMQGTPEAIVSRNLWQIIALMAPGAVVSCGTALENRPAPDGSVFLTGAYSRTIVLPGLVIRQIAGSGSVKGDTPYMASLHLASPRIPCSQLLGKPAPHTAAHTSAEGRRQNGSRALLG